MRLVIVTLLTAVLAASALAQYPPNAYVSVQIPSEDCVLVIHPTDRGQLFLPDGNEWDACDVRIGQSEYDHWGDCWFDEPLLAAESLLITPDFDVDGFVLLEDPVPLDALPAEDGWTTVDLANLRGGGHGGGPGLLFATVPEYSPCYLHNTFSVKVRSTDISGDLTVDLTDVVLFVRALGEYQAYADFRPDGVINLSDIVVMSQGLHGR